MGRQGQRRYLRSSGWDWKGEGWEISRSEGEYGRRDLSRDDVSRKTKVGMEPPLNGLLEVLTSNRGRETLD